MESSTGNLKRPRVRMPAHIRKALNERGLMEKYKARPAYQRNDYLGWISRAKLQTTRDKRLAQMLNELERGGVYMNMKWQPKPTR